MAQHPFHPSTVIRRWPRNAAYTIADSLTGNFICGMTGSGKSSGPSRHLITGMLEAGYSALFCCAKPSDADDYEEMAKQSGRSADFIRFDASGVQRFDPLAWINSLAPEAGGFVMNSARLLTEIASVIAKAAGAGGDKGGENSFWEQGLFLLITQLCALANAGGEAVTIPYLRALHASAPQTVEHLSSREFQAGAMGRLLARLAEDAPNRDERGRADLAGIFTYWTQRYAFLDARPKSIFDIMADLTFATFDFEPNRTLFASGMTLTPENCIEQGKLVCCALDAQTYGLAGIASNLILKQCFHAALLRRAKPKDGFLRPFVTVMDEAQNFLVGKTSAGGGDVAHAAVCRASAGSMMVMVQNIAMLRMALGGEDGAAALQGNLQHTFICASVGETAQWASETLIGKRWVELSSRSASSQLGQPGAPGQMQGSVSRAWQEVAYVPPIAFGQLKRGGPGVYDHKVSCYVHRGGALTDNGSGEAVPYLLLTFDQKA